MGASNHSDKERAQHDYYATEPKAVEMLLELEGFDDVIYEPAVGGGHIAEVLKQYGKSVICRDIVDYGYEGTAVEDFLQTKFINLDLDIITNPPYNKADLFVDRAIKCVSKGHKVAMFLKLTFLEGKKRKELFNKYPPKTIYVSSSRLNCARNGDFDNTQSAVCYAWFVWEKGYTGTPQIKWFN